MWVYKRNFICLRFMRNDILGCRSAFGEEVEAMHLSFQVAPPSLFIRSCMQVNSYSLKLKIYSEIGVMLGGAVRGSQVLVVSLKVKMLATFSHNASSCYEKVYCMANNSLGPFVGCFRTKKLTQMDAVAVFTDYHTESIRGNHAKHCLPH